MRFGPSMSCFQRSSTLGWLTLCRRRNLGYLVHPSLATRLDRFSRIADIGTGTGIYLIELSRQLPATCRLDGFDISDVQYPSPEALPANVSLALQNAKQAFPAALKGKYGLVHLRLLMSAMEKDDWEVVAANAVRLLKPGGAIQWAEGDFLHSAYLRSGSETGLRIWSMSHSAFMKALDIACSTVIPLCQLSLNSRDCVACSKTSWPLIGFQRPARTSRGSAMMVYLAGQIKCTSRVPQALGRCKRSKSLGESVKKRFWPEGIADSRSMSLLDIHSKPEPSKTHMEAECRAFSLPSLPYRNQHQFSCAEAAKAGFG
jgi:SAM-dependent methyltransferase